MYSKKQEDFIATKIEGLRLEECWDMHAHLLGIGDSKSGIYLHPKEGMSKSKQYIKNQIFKYFTKSTIFPTDESYLDYFIENAENTFPGFKVSAFAFTGYYDEEGNEKKELSDFIIPNEWSLYASKKSNRLLYVTSIHPNSKDAIINLEKAKQDGAIAIKWLPCAQNINPADKKYENFYEKAKELNLPIITHAGAEHAVEGSQFVQDLGNPLHLRLPLEIGVKVIIAHCATEGIDMDFEESKTRVPSYNLFSRLMSNKNYENNLFADISATPQINRSKWLPLLLERKEWHHRLLNGSDYPLPCIPILFSLRWLKESSLISEKDVWMLNGIRKLNPLMFDFLLKRCLSHNGNKFDNLVFETKRVFM